MEPFKNYLGAEAARKIARSVAQADPSFNARRFLKGIEAALEPLELKGRMLHLKDRLVDQLDPAPARGFAILADAAEGLEGFLVWPLTQVVAERGLESFDESMAALHRMTQVFTAEFAVRPFFLHDEARTLRRFERWLEDPSEHVRRLVSEGSRPLLPWGQRLPSFVRDPSRTWALLEALRHDPAEYVRKSVANHVNDHSKNHPDWVVSRLAPWSKEADPGLAWIVRHATRTLVKAGHPGALKLHGIGDARIEVLSQELLTRRVRLGEKLEARVTIRNTGNSAARVIVDQEVSFLKANGKTSPKVFKGKVVELGPRETREVPLSLAIREVTTRVHYLGTQEWASLVNGGKGEPLEFVLSAARVRH